ncbi:073a6314-5033-465a-90f3-a3f0e47616a9 [Thermothielavioides terrestris]|uniref:073a6314-5033-465a-90f3-a3f0e47616a9 n=1 Tax=Thermothielavioides terrestris TaxID=2587410 RepID=A0A3S4AQ33_9PEZI|nr:073a6314-5033-465a-90f3-a3f0e47616a9 [Thermothielavioides terrestris]
MTKFTFEIDVYSDTICPWCYIGKKALDNAIATYTAQHPDAEFKLTWKPYMLWPHARVSAFDKGELLRAIYGPDAPAMLERFTRLGAEYGIDFRSNTHHHHHHHHHLLLLLRRRHNNNNNNNPLSSPPNRDRAPTPLRHQQTHQDRTVTHLFASALTRQEDLSSRAFLARAAVELGLLPTEAAAHAYLAMGDGKRDGYRNGSYDNDHNNNNNNSHFDDDEDDDDDDDNNHDIHDSSENEEQNEEQDEEQNEEQNEERNEEQKEEQIKEEDKDEEDEASLDPGRLVDASSARARQIGVTAVPSYVVQGRWQVGGMQREGVWLGLFETVVQAAAAATTASSSAAAGGGGGDGGGGAGAGRHGRVGAVVDGVNGG